jgi:hypothetical protein
MIGLEIVLCFASVYCVAPIPAWDQRPWMLVGGPLVLGMAWLLVTLKVIRRAPRKGWLILLAIVEAPFAFAWPVWIVAFIVGEGMRQH